MRVIMPMISFCVAQSKYKNVIPNMYCKQNGRSHVHMKHKSRQRCDSKCDDKYPVIIIHYVT